MIDLTNCLFWFSVLLERVYFRVTNASTDQELETQLCQYLVPVIAKVASKDAKAKEVVSNFGSCIILLFFIIDSYSGETMF